MSDHSCNSRVDAGVRRRLPSGTPPGTIDGVDAIDFLPVYELRKLSHGELNNLLARELDFFADTVGKIYNPVIKVDPGTQFSRSTGSCSSTSIANAPTHAASRVTHIRAAGHSPRSAHAL